MAHAPIYATYALYALVCYLPIALALKLAMNFRAREIYNSDDMIRSGNQSVAFRRAGAHLGLAIAMVGVASGQTNPDLVTDILNMLSYGLLAAVFMMSSMLVTDKLILPGVDNTMALRDNNMAVGTVEFGALVATGLMAYASIHGDNGHWITSVIYFLCGQVALVLITLGYERLFSARKLVERVNKGEMASGIYLSGKLIAYGLVLQAAVIGPATGGDLATAATDFLIAAVGGMALLIAFEWAVDKVIVTSTTVGEILAENQVPAAIQLAVPKVGFALFLGMAML